MRETIKSLLHTFQVTLLIIPLLGSYNTIAQNKVRVSSTGANILGCGAFGNECQTIAYGISQANSGDTIFIYDGIYNEWDIQLPEDTSLHFIGESYGNVIIDALTNDKIFEHNYITPNAYPDSTYYSFINLVLRNGQQSGTAVINNSTGYGAGLDLRADNDNMSSIHVDITNCIIHDNKAQLGSHSFRQANGGGIYFKGRGNPSSVLNVTGSIFYNNVAQQQNNGGKGGAIRVQDASANICSSTFYKNEAIADGGTGFDQGDVCNDRLSGGAIHFDATNNIVGVVNINDCIFSDNKVYWNIAPTGTCSGCQTLAVTTGAAVKNGCLSIGSVDIANCLTYNNYAGSGNDYEGAVTIGGGMIYNQDPLFVDTNTYNLSLQCPSPAIDTASNICGLPYNGSSRDIGALESIITPLFPNAGNDTLICYGDSIQLSASGGAYYFWSPSFGLSDSTVSNPIAAPDTTTTYILTVTDSCSWEYDTITIMVTEPILYNVSQDSTLCIGETIDLMATGGDMYLWSTGDTIGTTTVSPTTSTNYYITIYDSSYCEVYDTVSLSVINVEAGSTSTVDTICEGESVLLTASGGSEYVWSTLDSAQSIIVSPIVSTQYIVTVYEGRCFDSDTLSITVNYPPAHSVFAISPICIGEVSSLTASGGDGYSWSTGHESSFVEIEPVITKQYYVSISHHCGITIDSVEVVVNPLPYAYAGADTTIQLGEILQLHGEQGVTYEWQTNEWLSCFFCQDPIFTPEYEKDIMYQLIVTDSNGCVNTDDITIYVKNPVAIWVPNAFSPNGDGLNDVFLPKGMGVDVDEFAMHIFNRWGELIFTSNNMEVGWDGVAQLKGGRVVVQEGTYVWKLIAKEEHTDTKMGYTGHVTLIK